MLSAMTALFNEGTQCKSEQFRTLVPSQELYLIKNMVSSQKWDWETEANIDQLQA